VTPAQPETAQGTGVVTFGRRLPPEPGQYCTPVYNQDHKAKFLQGFDGPFTGFNVFAPRYDLVAPHLSISDYSSFIDNINTVRESGATAQAFLRPTDKLTIGLGLRFSDAKLISDRKAGSVSGGEFADLEGFLELPFTRFNTDTRKTVGQVGATYAITPAINLYASYGQTLESQVGVFIFDAANPRGRNAPPEEGECYEVGFKGEFLDNRVSASLAAFDMKRSNLTQPHPQSDLQGVLGSQESKGVEVEMQGAIARGANLFVSLASMNPKYVGGRFDGLQSANGGSSAHRSSAVIRFPTDRQKGSVSGPGLSTRPAASSSVRIAATPTATSSYSTSAISLKWMPGPSTIPRTGACNSPGRTWAT
jgi:outer membrane receptor protein involved in Fe transport